MRATLLALIITFLAVVGCGGRDLENELNFANSQLQAERTARQQAERNEAEARAIAEELRARGNPISSLRMTVTVQCSGDSGADPHRVRVGTVAVLTRSDGGAWRFIDDMSTPQIVDLGAGKWEITFGYHPEDQSAVLTQDVETLRQVAQLGLRYGRVFELMGLQMTEAGVTRLRLELNGIPVLDTPNLGVPSTTDAEGFQRLEVSGAFSSIPDTYYASLRQRALSDSAR